MSKTATLAGRLRVQDLMPGISTAEIKHQELLDLKAFHQAEPKPQETAISKHQENVSRTVSKLQMLYADISTRGNHNRLDFNRQMQHDLLVAEIRSLTMQLAEGLAGEGYSEEKTRTICQAFIDDVRIGLINVGIYINPLYLRKLRGREAEKA